jgi:hypothetical protein
LTLEEVARNMAQLPRTLKAPASKSNGTADFQVGHIPHSPEDQAPKEKDRTRESTKRAKGTDTPLLTAVVRSITMRAKLNSAVSA